MSNKQEKTVRVEFDVVVTGEDIDDIMCVALEGGINYWCGNVKVLGDYLGEYAHEQISRGGKLALHDFEEEETYVLDEEKFIDGLKKYLALPICGDFLEMKDGKLVLDTGYADADVADAIVQYALFGEIVYG